MDLSLGNIKQKYLEMMERKERNKESPEKEGTQHYFRSKSSEYPAALYSHKSKTFKRNKRKGL